MNKDKMKPVINVICYIIGIFFILSAIFLRPIIIQNILLLFAGIVILPPISKFIQSKVTFFPNYIKWGIVTIVFLLVAFTHPLETTRIEYKTEDENIAAQTEKPYEFVSYIIEGKTKIDKIYMEKELTQEEEKAIYEERSRLNTSDNELIIRLYDNKEKMSVKDNFSKEIKMENGTIQSYTYQQYLAKEKEKQDAIEQQKAEALKIQEEQKKQEEEKERAEQERIRAEEAKAKEQQKKQQKKQQSSSSSNNKQTQTQQSTVDNNNSRTVYKTETGKKYHSGGCSYLRQSKIPISLSNAKAEGLGPCSRCNP